jgi:hypothetical protein
MTQVPAIATMTQVPAITTATTKAKLLKLDEWFLHPAKSSANNATIKSESLLLHDQFSSAILTTRIHAQNLLLLPVRDNSAIMIATNASSSLQLIVESFSTGAKQVAPATIWNNSFKLIDALASEGATIASYIFWDAFYAKKLNHEGAYAQATSFQTSKLIVIYSKIPLHFHEDCSIFCEGEWEQQQRLNKHNGLVGLSLIGHPGIARLTGLVCLIGLVDFIGLNGLIGLIGLITGLVSLIGLVGHISCNGLTSLIGHIGLSQIGRNGFLGRIGHVGLIKLVQVIAFVGLVGLIGLVGYIGLIGHNGLFNFGLVSNTGLIGIFSLVGLGFVVLNGLVGFIGLVGLIGLVLATSS